MKLKNVVFLVILSSLGAILTFSPDVTDITKQDLTSTDGFYFEGKEFEHKDFRLKIVTIETQEEFDSIREKINPNSNDVPVFTSLNPYDNTCTIYIKDPKWEYFPEFIGHAVSHCIWGRWHNHQNKPYLIDTKI